MQGNTISAEIEPAPQRAQQAALALQRLGFRIMHIGATISVQAPRSLWETAFNVTFEQRKKTVIAEVAGSETTYLSALTEDVPIPTELQDLIVAVAFVEPPEFYSMAVG